MLSAGISDEERGNPIDRRAARVLRENGHDVPDHRARQVQARELGDWDLVLAMTDWHFRSLQRLARRAGVKALPGAAPGDPSATDIRMFRAFDPDVPVGDDPTGEGRPDLDVPDPWYGGHEDFVETLHTVERTTPAIVDHIRHETGA